MHQYVQYIVHIERYALFEQLFVLVTFTSRQNRVEILTILSQRHKLKIEQMFGIVLNINPMGGHLMEINANEIKQEICEILDRITDLELLDFVHKLLLSECS